MTPPDPERAAFYAALEANPEDWLNYLVFSDWLRDRGEDELADGFAAMGRLRVRLSPQAHGRQQGGVNSFGRTYPMYEIALRRERAGGDHWFVTEKWYDAVFELWGGSNGYGERAGAGIVPSDHELLDNVALAYARLTPVQKAEAERLLIPPRVGDP